MCDYSLVALRTRLAIDREELVTYRFPTGSIGFTAPAELERFGRDFNGLWSSFDPSKVACAVCIPPGARMRLCDIPERLQQPLGIGAQEDVVFIQMSAEAGRHRDGIRFSNGQEILLQRLSVDQYARVLSLSSSLAAEQATEEIMVGAV